MKPEDSELEDLKQLLESLRFLEKYLLFVSIREVSLYYFGWAIAVILGGMASGFIWEVFQDKTLSSVLTAALWVCLAFIVGFLSHRALQHRKVYIMSKLPPEKRREYIARLRKANRNIAIVWGALLLLLYFLCYPLLSKVLPAAKASSLMILLFVALGNLATYRMTRRERIPMAVGMSLLVGSPIILVLPIDYVYVYLMLLIFVVYMLAGIAYLNKADRVLGF